MALTKAQLSLVSVATLGVAPGGYTAQLAAFNTQKEAAAFIATTGLLNEGTNAEFVNTVARNLNNLATPQQKADFLKALDDGASRSDATVDFANTVLVFNGSIANVNKAIASTSTSMDLDALKAELAEIAPTPVDSSQVTFNTASGTGFLQRDLKANLGKAEIENGTSKISADFTFNLKNQANVFSDGTGLGGNPVSNIGEFTGAFLSPMLKRDAPVQSDSAIYVRMLDGFATRDNFQPIERLATNGIGFSIDGVNVVVADKPEDGDQGAIYKAKNYVELKDAITARLAELASGQGLPAGADAATYAKLATFTVELGSNFSKVNQAGNQVTGTELVIKDASGSTLVSQGFSTYGGVHPYTDLNSINELTNQPPATSTQLISTNINAENVGYGSQGGTLNIAGQSASNKGVEEFKVTATKDVWFTRLESRDLDNNQHLQEVLLQSGSNGYFRVGMQDKGDSLVALVDQNFGVKGGGLVDVLKLDAAAANSTAVNAFISDKVIARNYNLKDTDANYKTDDVEIQYNLTSGDDVLQLALASEVVAYADTQVTINTGTGGNDIVHLKIVDNALNGAFNVVNAGAGTYGTGWLVNQQLNDNIKVEAMSGNNTIWTEGSGNVRISTGAGNDVILADNSARQTIGDTAAKAKMASLGYGDKVNGLYVVNAASRELGNILSNSANPTDGVASVNQTFNTFKTTVSVSFMGLESSYIEIASTNYRTTTQQVNQAIKKAINEDATLSKLIQAIEFPGNVLVIESLIDGVRTLGELSFNFVAPAASGTLPAALLPGQLVLGANDLTEAGKAYAPAGTVAPAVPAITALDFTNNAAGINTIYNTNKNFVADGAAAVQEVQTLTVTAGVLAATDTVTVTLGTDDAGSTTTAVFTASAALATPAAIVAAMLADAAGFVASVTTAGWSVAAGAAGELVFTHTAGGVNINTNVSAVSADVAGDLTYSAVASAGAEITAGAAGAGDVTGVASTAHSDNVINAGAGNDVIVLGTGTGGSNDTVVLSGNFGKNTILNFNTDDVNDTAGNSGDLLDFRSYLDANVGAGGANVSITAATGGIVNNAIAVIEFSALQGAVFGLTATADQIATTTAMSAVTTAQWDKVLNAAYDAAATATKNVFIVHNDNTTNTLDNIGEYLVLTASSSNAAGAAGTTFTGVTVVGTLDFGSTVGLDTAANFASNMSGNLVGFEGVIV